MKPRHATLPRRSERGLTLIQLLIILGVVVVVVTIAAVAIRPGPVPVDASGKARFQTKTIPTWEFDVQCHGGDKPTVGDVKYMDTPPEGRKLDVTFAPRESNDCTTHTGKAGKKSSWDVSAKKTYKPDLGNSPPQQTGAENLGTLDCPCMEPEVRILYLKWKDQQMVAYPGGERATYYNVRFELSEPATGQQLASWLAWIRLAGGHTHYGHEAGKQIIIDRSKCTGSLVECAQQESGWEFKGPPESRPPVG